MPTNPAPFSHALWAQFEQIIRRDPGQRGLAQFRHDGRWLLEGDLESAARHLAEHAQAVAVVTGFCIVDANPPAAETDGPPGALFLARALTALGIDVVLMTDSFGRPLLEAGCDLLGLSNATIREIPFEPGGPDGPDRQSNTPPHNRLTDDFVADFFASEPGRRLTHLVAIERAGPCHAADDYGHCQNMRGMDINGYTAKTHRLFEWIAERRLPITTIGIGDGGNEIGMGKMPHEVLRRAIASPHAERIACRIPTDHAILCGVSNWGGYALALAVCHFRGRGDVAADWDAASEQRLIEHLVTQAGAVDGVARRRQPTVDGLLPEVYASVLTDLRRPTLAVPVRTSRGPRGDEPNHSPIGDATS